MRIAIQAADLDASRIDGTRVYIANLLKYFGRLAPDDEFLVYHRKEFNPELAPPDFPNYKIRKIEAPFLWTQTRFAMELWKDCPDVLWMPMHNIPLVRKRNLKTVVTIHDLAYKYFPEDFPKKDLFELNFLGDLAIKQSDKIIAISESTKKDILRFYSKINPEKIAVVYHGFDADLFQKRIPEKEIEAALKGYNLKPKNYILYIGAIQPRKSLETLIKAFGELKKRLKTDLKLVLAGEKAWLSQSTFREVFTSPFREDILTPGKLKFSDLSLFMSGAGVFVFPSKYEGFGIPILEAMASGVPVLAAHNSSLPEVGGEAAGYFDSRDYIHLSNLLEETLSSEFVRENMILKGFEQIKKFSWEKCARETLDVLKG